MLRALCRLRSPLTCGLKLVSSPGAKTQNIISSPVKLSPQPKCVYVPVPNVPAMSPEMWGNYYPTASLADFLDSTADTVGSLIIVVTSRHEYSGTEYLIYSIRRENPPTHPHNNTGGTRSLSQIH